MKNTIRTLLCLIFILLVCMLMLTACDMENGGEQETDSTTDESEESTTEGHVHAFGEWGIIKDSTCTENGVKSRKCTTCGKEETDTVAPSHTWIEATCVTPKTCDVCGETEGDCADHAYTDAVCAVCQDIDYTQLANLTYDGSEVTITFYHTMGASLREILERSIQQFNDLYPNITVKHVFVGSYSDVRDQISTDLASKNQPNIAYCYPDHIALYNLSNAVVTLDELLSSKVTTSFADGTVGTVGLTDMQKADFIQGFYEEGRQFGDGKMYSMPLSKSTEVLYYNKTFFEQHNLQVPTTWEEMEAVCAYIKAIDPNSIPLGYDSEANWFTTMCEQLGSPYTGNDENNHFLFDNETNRAFVKMLSRWYDQGYITTQEILGSYTSMLFTEGNCYMCIASSSGASYHRSDFEVGIAPIPQVDPDNPKAISQGPSLCIFKQANAQEILASWLFVKHLTTNVAFQAELSMASGYLPVIQSVMEHPVYREFLKGADGSRNIIALAVKICMEQMASYYTLPAFHGSDFAREQVAALLIECLTYNTSDPNIDELIKKAFEQAVEECNSNIG